MASALVIKKGNPYTAIITVTDSDGGVYNLSDKIVFFTVKSVSDVGANDSNALIKKDITSHTNPTGGVTTLELTTLQTDISVGYYKYDFRIYQASPLVQLNSVQGICQIQEIVTKRIS